jgi:hypothetical protein
VTAAISKENLDIEKSCYERGTRRLRGKQYDVQPAAVQGDNMA